MKNFLFLGVSVLVFIGAAVFLSTQLDLMETLQLSAANGQLHVAYGVYVLILILAVVCMPFTVMPLIPVAASIFGPFITGVLSVIGWTLGSMAAFLIARHVGRPVLKRLLPLKKIDELLSTVPKRSRFMFIVLLRLTLPVDIASYALGLTKSLRFIEYSTASFVGVLWSSFSFAYLGDALLKGNLIVSAQLAIASLVIFLIGWYLLKRSNHSDK